MKGMSTLSAVFCSLLMACCTSKTLFECAETGDVACIQRFGSDPTVINQAREAGDTALHLAAMEGQDEAVRALLAAGANINAQTLQGFTALHHAASRGHRDVVLVLIEGGADTSLRNGEGKLASDFAVIGGVTDLLPPR